MNSSTVIARGIAPKHPPVIAKSAGLKQSLVIARGKARKQSPRRCAPRDDAVINVIASVAKQSGFGLLELMLATTIAAGITLGYLYNQSTKAPSTKRKAKRVITKW